MSHHSATEPLVSTTVVHAVADATGRDPLDLPPLYEVLETDALDALVAGEQRGRRPDRDVLELRFRYAGVDVRVRGNGEVDVDTSES